MARNGEQCSLLRLISKVEAHSERGEWCHGEAGWRGGYGDRERGPPPFLLYQARRPARSLARPFRNLRLDLRQLWVTVDQPRFRKRKRERGKEEGEGHKIHKAEGLTTATSTSQCVCVCVYVSGTGMGVDRGPERFTLTERSIPPMPTYSVSHNEYIARLCSVLCRGELCGRKGRLPT